MSSLHPFTCPDTKHYQKINDHTKSISNIDYCMTKDFRVTYGQPKHRTPTQFNQMKALDGDQEVTQGQHDIRCDMDKDIEFQLITKDSVQNYAGSWHNTPYMHCKHDIAKCKVSLYNKVDLSLDGLKCVYLFGFPSSV